MNKVEAVIAIIRDSRANGSSRTSMQRVLRALRVLELQREDINTIMVHLDYYRPNGDPYPHYIKP